MTIHHIGGTAGRKVFSRFLEKLLDRTTRRLYHHSDWFNEV